MAGTAIQINGKSYAAGLDWYLPRDEATGVFGWLRYARELEYGLAAVRKGDYAQAAFGSAGDGLRPGLRAAAAISAASVPPGVQTWQGLIPCDDGRALHVRVNGGLIEPDAGDVVHPDIAGALEPFERMRSTRIWDALYAPEDFGIESAKPFPMGNWPRAARRAPRLQETAKIPRPVRYAAIAGAVIAAASFALPIALDWFRPPPPPPPKVVELPPPVPPPGVDSVAFLLACARARNRAEMPIPGWRRVETDCGHGLSSQGLVEAGDGTLLVNWRHNRERDPFMRRVAERRLAGLDGARGIVDARNAIAAAPIAEYGIAELPLAQSLTRVRRNVDERLGPIADRLQMQASAAPSASPPNTIAFEEWTIAVETRHPIAELAARPVDHVEWLRVVWPAGGGLRAEGRIRIATGFADGGKDAE